MNGCSPSFITEVFSVYINNGKVVRSNQAFHNSWLKDPLFEKWLEVKKDEKWFLVRIVLHLLRYALSLFWFGSIMDKTRNVLLGNGCVPLYIYNQLYFVFK